MTAATSTATSNREAWLAERRTYLGGTDLAAIMGQNPYASPLTVYCSKLGITEPGEETKAMRRGNRMEPYVAETFHSVHGWPVSKAAIVRHPEKSHLAVNPDFEAIDPGFGRVALETKSHKFFLRDQYGEDWTDEVPPHEVIQGTWQCHLGGYSSCIVAVMFGMDEDDLHPFRVNYDPELGAMIEEAGDRFWQDHILPQVPPSISGATADAELLKRLYPYDRGTTMYADERLNEIVEELREARAARKRAEKSEANWENQVKEAMGDAAILETAHGRITWKQAASGPVSWKAVAETFNPSPQLIAQHTGPGSRRFLVPFKGE